VSLAEAASPVYALCERYVEELAALDPVSATVRGIAGHDGEMTDYSPDGIEARAAYARDTLTRLGSTPSGSHADRLAAGVLGDHLEMELAQHEAGEPKRDLRIIFSPMQQIRGVFDLMPTSGEEAWENILARMEKVPAALAGLTRSLGDGLVGGTPAARRQAVECARQAEAWSGADGSEPFFVGYVAKAPPELPDALRDRLTAAAAAASDGYGLLGRYLREDYAPRAPERDAVGSERYSLACRRWLGTDVDPVETYEWGWHELRRIEAEMALEAARIHPGATIAEAQALLESDPARAIEGVDVFRGWLQDLMDSTVADLNGTHFDIPGPVTRVEAMIAPPGGAAAMYYTGPSEDFSRPGRTWYPTLGKTRFPLWGEVSIAYHEGVPGHHLQIGQVRFLSATLSRFQRVHTVSGHAEGWALYAERLMDELGYLEKPDYRFGQLRAQALRAVRVIVDTGLHLELVIPPGDFHPGDRWTPDLALEFAEEHAYFPADFMASEIARYLGLPAQAIGYKVGERVWLEARDEVKARHGAAFDLKAFHAAALDLGPLGLDQLRTELAGL
jgi:uncharacterized protein (DUF885 family)